MQELILQFYESLMELNYEVLLWQVEYHFQKFQVLNNFLFALASDRFSLIFDYFCDIHYKNTSQQMYLIKTYRIKNQKFPPIAILLPIFFLLREKKIKENSQNINGKVITLNQDHCDKTQSLNHPQLQRTNEPLPQLNHSTNNTVIKTLIKIILSQKSKDVLKQIIENQRAIDEMYKFYIRQQITFQELCQEYSIKNLALKNNLKAHCNAMIPVRGDGNCFYTAFAYQYFKLIINDQHLLKELENSYSKIQLQINKDNQQLINEQVGKQCLIQFFTILKAMALIPDQVERNEMFLQFFSAHKEENHLEGFLNPLSVIYLRNLCYKFVIESDEYRDMVFDKENLLIWEKECNNNEPIIVLLAQKLNIHIKLIFFDNSNFNIIDYSEENKNTIILLIRPGHYNVGLNQKN